MANLICLLLYLYLFVLLVRIVLSWIPLSEGGAMEAIANLFFLATEPVLGPLRRVIPPVRMGSMALDLSPIIVFLGISILRGIICA